MVGYIYRAGEPHIEQTAKTFRPGADPERTARMARLRRSHAVESRAIRPRGDTRAMGNRRAIEDQSDR